MNHRLHIQPHALSLIAAMLVLIVCSGALRADTGTCGGASITLPFTDVQESNIFFCSIAEAFFSGLTNGTTATTYNPSDTVPREQMAAFVTRTMDQSLKRGNHRAFMEQWWTPGDTGILRSVSVGANSRELVFDGQDLWVVGMTGGIVSRVRASDGRVMQTWTGASGAIDVIAAAGRIFIAGNLGGSVAGKIYSINPEAAAGGAVTVFEPDVGFAPLAINFDGVNLWTANSSGSITRVNAANGIDSTFTGFSTPTDILWDGANLWITDDGDSKLKRIDPSNGVVLEAVPGFPGANKLLFDGTNLWVSNFGGASVTVVRAVGSLRGSVLATLTGNGLSGPYGIAFDGERVLVCNYESNSVSLFKASDLTPLGNLSTGANSHPEAARSDGVNFWIVRPPLNDMVRF